MNTKYTGWGVGAGKFGDSSAEMYWKVGLMGIARAGSGKVRKPPQKQDRLSPRVNTMFNYRGYRFIPVLMSNCSTCSHMS